MTAAAARSPLARRSLGLGLDLRWGAPVGFHTDRRGRDRASPRLRALLEVEGAARDRARDGGGAPPAPRFSHAFFSFQPRDRGRLRVADYAPAWDDLRARLPADLPLGLHHTALNLASLEPAGRGRAELLDFTNGLCARAGLSWINEDVGFWSLGGRPLPYPLPPILDAAGLAACARNVRACQRELVAPLVLEFPGFAAGVSLATGDMDAYDFFRRLADETGAPVTLDVAHLLSWRWWRGFRGQALLDDLERLPLAACVEVHLSGCEIADERFIDAHHGRLLDEQFALLERLLPACPSLRAITFEDPGIGDEGALDAGSAVSLARLRGAVGAWLREGDEEEAATAPPPAPAPPAQPSLPAVLEPAPADGADGGGERALVALLFDREARARWRRDQDPLRPFAALDPAALEETSQAVVAMVRGRSHRGTGRLADVFPRCVAAWRALAPDDVDLDELHARFLASPAAAPWREQPAGEPGACVEACFAAFGRAEGLVDPATAEDELLSALLRTLAITPDPAFVVPPPVRRATGGWLAVSAAQPPVLHAAVRGRYLRGEITPLVEFLLRGATVEEAAQTHNVPEPAVEAVRARLDELGL